MFKILNNYTQTEIKDLGTTFRMLANKKCYPLRQAQIENVNINYLPLSIEKSRFAKTKCDLVNIYSAISKLLKHYSKLNILDTKFNFSDIERKIYSNVDWSSITGVLRFDLILSTSGFKIVEIDADPDALFLHDITFNTLASVFDKNYYGRNINHLDLYIRLLNEQGIQSNKGTILVDPETKFREEYEIRRRVLANFGYNLTISSDLLNVQSDSNFILKAFEFHKILQNNRKELDKLLEFKVVNNLQFRLIGYKNLFTFLHHEINAGIFNIEEVKSIKKIVPKTLIYSNIIQKQHILKRKDKIVLKPILGAEGHDVYICKNLSKAELTSLLTNKILPNSEWLIQDLVETTQVDYRDQNGKDKKKYFDFSPHLFIFKSDKVFGRNLVRYSNNEILNVAQGGTFGYGIEV